MLGLGFGPACVINFFLMKRELVALVIVFLFYMCACVSLCSNVSSSEDHGLICNMQLWIFTKQF